MQRRQLLTATAPLWLAACGFELRRTPELPFATLHANFAPGSTLADEFRRQLAATGSTRLVADSERLQAQVWLIVLADRRERAVVGVGAVGQVREFQLRQRFTFRASTPQGRVLIEDTELTLQRDLSYNETQALAKMQEEELLFRDMQTDIVGQVIRRLAAVRP